jgi:hypothetical protein
LPKHGDGLFKLQAKPCFRQTLAGDAVENWQCQKINMASFGSIASKARYGVQDNAERGAEAFLWEKVGSTSSSKGMNVRSERETRRATPGIDPAMPA